MLDELTPIARYMAQEMNVNAHGPDARKMAELNADTATACVTEYFKASWWRRLFGAIPPQQCYDIEISNQEAALMMWGMKVRQNGDWDHKPKLHRFVSATTKKYSWHAYDTTVYYYDIWSNIHYGYVGIAAGFSEDVLLDGAGLEQIGSDLLRRRWPTRSLGVQGLRAFDDDSDRTAIELGIELYNMVPNHVSAAELVETILMTPGLQTDPISGSNH